MGSNENSPVFESFQKALDYLYDISKVDKYMMFIIRVFLMLDLEPIQEVHPRSQQLHYKVVEY